MKIALCQLNSIIGDIEGNKAKILKYYHQAVIDEADIIIFPELALPGYPPLDLVEKKEFRNKVIQAANSISSQTKKTAILFGSIVEDFDEVGTGIYNSAILAFDGKMQFIQNKTLIPNYDVFDEVRYFESAKSISVFDFKGEKLGISICEDIWNDSDYWKERRYPKDPIQELIEQGSTILINISASPYAFGRRQERYEMLSLLSRNDKIQLIYVCAAGAQTELVFDGGSMCFDSRGSLYKIGKLFDESYELVDTKNTTPINHVIERSYEEEVHDALVLGLRDYAYKSNFKKALIGLSGGIDSALVTYLAVQALGKENVNVVLMPSMYSSEGSITDSEKLIMNLGINAEQISIKPIFNTITDSLSDVFESTKPNVAEENIQARIRGLLLMAIANKFNYLLCTTGNKSEIAVGYATLYGDMCGALAVIGDIYKTDVYRISKFINKENEIIPIEIINKPPSAELRFDQKDQDSLPEYEILDKILRMYLEDYKEIDEISKEISNPDLISEILKKVDLNEFKRKQAAPILRVTKKAFGYGRRFPIVQKWHR